MQIRVSMRDGGAEVRGGGARQYGQRELSEGAFTSTSHHDRCGVEKTKRTNRWEERNEGRGEEIEDTGEIPWKGWQDHPR
jgi:hypothetical protein